MLILLTNDDGISACGLTALKDKVSHLGDVWVVAPDREQSGTGHSLSLRTPLKVSQIGEKTYGVNGTPTDAVMVGVFGILKRKPDLLISGINHGPNLGDDVTYSGTVAAAIEGTLLDIPSLAISMVDRNAADFERAAEFVAKLARFVLREKLPKDTFLNVNIPKIKGEITKYKITKLGKRIYKDIIIEREDPNGDLCYWIGGEEPSWQKGKDTDFSAIEEGKVSITPLHLDFTNYKAIEEIKRWKIF